MQKADKLRVEMATCAPEHECGEATIWREAGCPLLAALSRHAGRPARCLLLARNRHAAMSDLSLLSGEERKSHFSAVTSVDDPSRSRGFRQNLPFLRQLG